MLEPRHQSSFEGASQAPTVAESTPSLAETNREKDADTASRHDANNISHMMNEKVQPMAPAPTEAGKLTELTKTITARSQNSNALRQTETREDGVEYPKGLKLFLISLALCLSVFLIALE